MDAIQFDQLPYLCLRKIFAFLNLRDLIKCRATTRQFKFYADEAAVDELVVKDKEIECRRYCKHWYLTDRPIDFENSIGPNAFASVDSSSLKLDQQLKFLHIHLEDFASFDLKVLNGFKQLVHLEIKSEMDNHTRTLILPNLMVLDVRAHQHASYVLKTPKLEVLACENVERIEVEYPERIKRLICDYRGGENHMAKFKNLLTLDCRFIFCDLNRIRLSDWKDLKELNLHMAGDNGDRYEELRSSLVALMCERAALRSGELKLYLDDVLLVDAKQLPLDYETMDAPGAFWFTNFRMLRHHSYPEVNELQFDHLMKLDVELSDDFFDRFPAIEYLTAIGRVDRDQFDLFLNKATALRVLTLKNTSLDQTFMDRLPKLSSRLIHLNVYESSGLLTNFNFVLQFEQLQVFQTDRQLGSLDLAAKAFRQLNELQRFQFGAGKECVEVCLLRFKNDYQLSFLQLDKLDNEPCDLIFCQGNLQWTELVALYEQKRAATSSASKGRTRIKRTRLQ